MRCGECHECESAPQRRKCVKPPREARRPDTQGVVSADGGGHLQLDEFFDFERVLVGKALHEVVDAAVDAAVASNIASEAIVAALSAVD